MSLSIPAVPLPETRWRRSRLALRIAAWALLVLWSLGLVLWLTLQWGILPRLDDWRPTIEREASHALGVPVQIGRIRVRSSSWVPALELDDVVLRDSHQREALRLPRVAAALSVPSLLALHLRFEQLLIDGPRLEVRRDAKGRLHVAGLDVDGQASSDGAELADWFFEQHEFVIRSGVLRWVDEQRSAAPLELAEVQLVIRNRLNRHELRLDATPPAAWGQRFSLIARARQPLLARASEWQRWRGSFYADLPSVGVADLRQHVDLPFDLAQGSGALRAWIDFDQGQAKGATVDVALRDIAVRLAPKLDPLAIGEASARIVADRQGEGFRVVAEHLAFATAEGRQWPAGRLALTWQPGAKAGGEVTAERLDLALMASLAERLPLGEGVRHLLAHLRPEGQIAPFSASWQGAIDAPTHYQVKANVKGMAIAAEPATTAGGVGRPGWRGADLELVAGETGGQAKLALTDGALEFPGVFEEPVLPLRRFAAQLQWRMQAVANGLPLVELKVSDAHFENDDVKGEASATWHTGAGIGSVAARGARLPGVLELQGKLVDGKAARVVRYLPLGIAASARDYVRRAVLGGQVASASFRVKGDLMDFPYVNRKEGEFRVAAQVRGVNLAYVPSLPAGEHGPAWESPWPAFAQVDGELVFERNAMQLRQVRGRLWGLELADVDGAIRELGPASVLEIEGAVRGPMTDFLRYVAVTPVGEWLSGALTPASASGPADLRLALALPLRKLESSTVKGSLQLQNVDLRLRPEMPLLAGARGRIDFTHKGVQVPSVAVRVLGGDAVIDGGTQSDGSLRFGASGNASADGLRRATEWPQLAQLAQQLNGQTPYRLQLGFARGQTELLLTSPLTGLAVDLPAPLRKSADSPLALRVQTTLQPDSRSTDGRAGAPPRDLLRIELGGLLQAQYLRELTADGPRVLRGALAVNAPLPDLAAGGVRAVADLAAFDFDAWSAALKSKAGDSAIETGPGAGYLPSTVQLKAREFTANARRLSNLSLGLQRNPARDGWRAQMEADQLSGNVDYREPRSASGAGSVRARLSRLALPPAEADSVAGLLDQAPASIPALDIEVDDFELRGRKLGRLSLEAVNRGAGTDAAREWQLSRLALKTPDGELSASGRWGAPMAGKRRMALDFKLDIADAGRLLDRLGYKALIKGGKGQLAGQVSWAGSPLALDFPTLDGQMTLALDAGQFLHAEPGAGRLLGVLSMQSLPRRLALDFRDVFQEGFAFDSMTANVKLAQGVATTNNFQMRGVQAAVLMEGSADVMAETQNLHVVVVPEINAGTASLAYAAINPAIGLGTFLGQWLLRGPLREAGTREFRVSGGWDDPQVVRVERSVSASAASSPQRSP